MPPAKIFCTRCNGERPAARAFGLHPLSWGIGFDGGAPLRTWNTCLTCRTSYAGLTSAADRAKLRSYERVSGQQRLFT